MPNNRTITRVPRVCRQCGRHFLARPDMVRKGFATFCSVVCRDLGRIGSTGTCIEFLDDDTAMVPLHARDGSIHANALIDAADAEWASQWRWGFYGGYAVRGQKDGDGRTLKFRMHRELMGLVRGDGLEVDHLNGIRHDNRRCNLRIVAKSVQSQNRRNNIGSRSQYRGVGWHKHEGKWQARVVVQGKRIHLGYFASEDEAGAAARAARLQFLPYAVD